MQTEKNLWLRVLSMILTLALLISCVPNQVYAMAGEALADLLDTTDTAVLQPNATPDPVLSTAQIVAEDETRRGETYKEYIMNNGLRLATVYPSAIHYEQNGQWKDIDNTLVATVSNGKAVYQNAAGAWNVRFPRNLSGSDMIGITKNGHTVQFGMAGELRSTGDLVVASVDVIGSNETVGTLAVNGAQTTVAEIQQIDMTAAREAAEHPETVLEKLNSRITYANVYPSTNVVYDLQGNRLKESVVLQRYDANLWGYRYTLDTGDLVPVLQEDQQIDLCHPETNEVILTMPAPYMLDDNGETSYDVEVILTQKGNQYLLSYYLPRAWLAEANRAWPVILDPVVDMVGTATKVKDCTVSEKAAESYTNTTLECGHNDTRGVMRFFLQYTNLPTMTSADVIVDATLSLYKPTNGTMDSIIEVHKVNEAWESKTVSWDNMPTYDPVVEDYVRCKLTGRYTWNLTDVVRGWYTNENEGILFKASDEIENAKNGNWKQFYSSDKGSSEQNGPLLTITFINSNGIEDYWDYTASSAGRAGTGYIQNYSGNLIWIHSDMGFDGNRMPVFINHVYSANDAGNNRFGLGNGWRTNYHQTVSQKQDEDGVLYYVWEDGDGTSHDFFVTTNGKYKDCDDLGLTLTVSETGYTISDEYDNGTSFDTSGRLLSMRSNVYGNGRISISYQGLDSVISEIRDGAGRKYIFSYSSNGLLSRIDYYGKGSSILSTIQYGYTDANLTSITYADGKISNYTYTEKNLILSATDVDGYKIAFEYDVLVDNRPSRVVKITEKHNGNTGATTELEYGYRNTVLKDHNGYSQTFFFNEWGNTTSVQSSEGSALFYQYATDRDENGIKNRLMVASRELSATTNLIADSSFEDNTIWESGANTTTEISLYRYKGNFSLLSTCTADDGAIGPTKAGYRVDVGETYTFSAYVDTSLGSKVNLRITDDIGTVINSRMLDERSDWTRLEVTYTNTSSAQRTIDLSLYHVSAGCAYMDCVQLERNQNAGQYSMVYDGDIERIDAWSFYSSGAVSPSLSTGSTVPYLSEKCICISGDINTKQCAYQKIKVAGAKGDRYVFSGWTKGDALPNIGGDRFYGLTLIFHNKDSSITTVRVAANPNFGNDGEWQYLAASAVAEKPYDYIILCAEYSNNSNTVYFDGLQLYRGEFGESYTYDDEGNIVTIRDTTGCETVFDYDSCNDLRRVEYPSGLIVAYDEYCDHIPCMVRTFYKDHSGQEHEVTYEEFGHDVYGNPQRHIAFNGETYELSTISYTEDGNFVASTTDENGNTTKYGYDLDTSVLLWVQYPEDTDGTEGTADTRTYYTYDSMFRLVGTDNTTDQGKAMSATYAYTNDLLTRISTKSTTYHFAYGNFGLRTQVSIGSALLASYQYSDSENKHLEQVEYGNGYVVEYSYDELGRLTKEQYRKESSVRPERTITYTYDNVGVLTTMFDLQTNVTTKYYYDDIGRAVGVTDTVEGRPHNIWYTYNDLGQLTKIREEYHNKSTETEYIYDQIGRIYAVKNGNTETIIDYDGYNRVNRQLVFHEKQLVFTETFTYADLGKNENYQSQRNRVSDQVVRLEYGNNPNYVAAWNYTYDKNGNILSVSDGQYTTTYVYDSANQLIRENNQKAGKTWVWTYDGAGNIKTKLEYGYTTGNVLGAATDSVNYVYGNASWGDLLTSYDNRAFQYDEIGNVLHDGTWSYTWTQGRQLATMSDGSITWDFMYDASGMRTRRHSRGNTYIYVYNGSQLSYMNYNGNREFWFAYDAFGRPMSVTSGEEIFYYILNLQGDVVAIVDSTGHVVVEYTYDAWGNLLSMNDRSKNGLGHLNPLRYRGYVYDQETGLYYLQSRYYNPEIGRFISADNLLYTGNLIGNNLYAYCFNNPVSTKDPNGHLTIAAIVGIAVSGLIGGVAAAVNAAASGKEGWEVAANFFIGAGVGVATAAVAAVAAVAVSAGMITGTAGAVAVAAGSAGIGFVGDGLSQLTEYAFHYDDPEYRYDWRTSLTSLAYSTVMNTASGLLSFGINIPFADEADEVCGVFVAGVASTALGGIDFGIRQLIGAIIELL